MQETHLGQVGVATVFVEHPDLGVVSPLGEREGVPIGCGYPRDGEERLPRSPTVVGTLDGSSVALADVAGPRVHPDAVRGNARSGDAPAAVQRRGQVRCRRRS